MKAKARGRKLLSILLTCILLLGLMPTVALAAAINITRIDINDFNPVLTDAMTTTEAVTHIQDMLKVPTDANYTADNVYIYIRMVLLWIGHQN